ncbi:MAG TPA: hypothetical protein ENN35_08540 [Deltaproteobacteria bacterium]|nr:hypothetical protein [Deltaproteobacteria bacterium]
MTAAGDSSIRAGSGVLFLCDFDGTLSPNDMGRDILRFFSTNDEWKQVTLDYVNGDIGSQEAYRKIAVHMRTSPEEMRRFVLDRGGLDPDFPAFYDYCTANGHDVVIASDGFDFYIETLLKRYGLADITYYANRIVFEKNRTVTVEFPHRNEECNLCGNCKLAVLRRLRPNYKTIIYVGDGPSDLCPAEEADLIFARDVLYRKYREMGRDCFYYRDFSDILAYFRNRATVA